jgi:capsular polysaccharide transport system permease protein
MSTTFWDSLQIHGRVLNALIRRELIVFYGRKGFGFLNNFIEPMGIMGVVMIFLAMRRQFFSHVNYPVYGFVITGWGVMWSCRYPFGKITPAIIVNRPFLFHRNIYPMDILISRTIVLLTGVMVGFWTIFLFYLTFLVDAPFNDVKYILPCFFFVYWYTSIFTIFLGTLRAYWPGTGWICVLFSIGHIWGSGAFFMADWVPQRFRDIYLLLPLVNMTEMFRYAIYGNVVPCYFNILYVLKYNLISSFLVLLFVYRTTRLKDIYDNPE